MANLKANLDDEINRLNKWGEEIRERFGYEVERAKTNLKESAEELAKLNDSKFVDLITKAAAAQSKEIEILYDRTRVLGAVDLQSVGCLRLVDGEGASVPKGKYRALFFLIPIKE